MARILWLHSMGPKSTRRTSVESLETCLSKNRYGQGHEVLIYDAQSALPDAARKIRWDGIILGPTFLCARYSPRTLDRAKRRFAWIPESKAVKIALPQDDYDCSGVLDRWLMEWRVDVCYSILPKFQTLLYPEYSQLGEFFPSFTGFVDDAWVRPLASLRPMNDRSWDVVYRANKLPANFGSLGILKSEIATRFVDSVVERAPNLRLNVAIGQGTLFGDSWHDFLSNSRFTLATPSGSSLLDPEGNYRRCVGKQPRNLNFDQVASNCFAGHDAVYSFECLAPRHLEASVLGTVQLAVPGDYSGVLEPDEHYIPLDRDLTNIDEVLAKMSDSRVVSRIQAAAHKRVTEDPAIQLGNFAEGLLNLVVERRGGHQEGHSFVDSESELFERLRRDSVRRTRLLEVRRSGTGSLRTVLDAMGLGQVLRRLRHRYGLRP